ncbi:MAG: hypothetical protein ABIW50_08205 [Candidatus Limnocylindria bacterium]
MPRSPTAPASALSPSLAPSPISGECEDQTQTLAVDPPTDPPRGLIDAADILTRALTWDEAWVTTGDGDRGTLPTIDDMPQLIVPEGTAMALHLTGDVAFVDYRAGVAIADRWPHRANEGNRMLRSGSTADAPFAVVCIPPPPLGDWVMNARLAYDLGRGYGDFYWHLVVQ